MNIIKNRDNDKLEIIIEGSLDTITAPEAEEQVKSSLDGVKELIFDFVKLDYISSSGLRVLLLAQKIMKNQGSMIIKNANEMVMEVFEVTGFIDILNIE